MISIVIGMVVVGAVLAAYLGMGNSSRNSRALAQMTEDVSIAMNVLRAHVAMAGYSAPTGVDASGLFVKNYGGVAVNGCQSKFTDTGAGIDVLACSGDGDDAIAVVYEADLHNSVTSGGLPLDCLGNTFAAEAGGYFLSYSRFYVDNEQLFCRGPGNAAAAALVENIFEMKVWYGVASNAPNQEHRVAYYRRAGGVTPMTPAEFNRVVSARICLVVASESDNVMDAATDYVDCEGTTQTPTDRRMYRAFTSTIVLNNRMGTN